jgi:nicotinamide-nucleotide amidase
VTPELIEAARATLDAARARGFKLAAAESCTGGMVMALLTEIAGSSDVVDRGFVTYSNEAKIELLGVDPTLILTHGAVSAQVATAMAEGALARSRADVAASITGVAGPGGGSAEKPVGLVQFACAARGRATIQIERRFGALGRQNVRAAAAAAALDLLRQACA